MGLIFLLVVLAMAQDRPTFRIKVDLVVLTFTITDNKGHYINGLQPKDFRILEDGIPQKLSTFSEGQQAAGGGGRRRNHQADRGGRTEQGRTGGAKRL